jgi:membrane fusion protein (multidrug efflux system)
VSAPLAYDAEEVIAYELGYKGTFQDGALQFSEFAVDESTGAVTLRALFPNPDGDLLPGMFVRARLPQGQRNNAILVPQKGIARDPTGQATAMVIGAEDKVESRQVATERAVGNRWLISDGLSEGDRLILEGLQKIRPGATVTPVKLDEENPPPSQAPGSDQNAKNAENAEPAPRRDSNAQ